MDTEQLDALLDAAARPARRLDPVDVRAMMVDAQAEARAPRRRRRMVVLGGALAVLLIGGGGVATAADLFPWTHEQERPYVAVDFVLPSGQSCEQRVFVVDAEQPAAGEWLRTYAADHDLMEAADVQGYLDRMEAWGEIEGSDDRRYWRAVNGALWEAMLEAADKAGFGSGALTGAQSQTYCTDERGNVVLPQ